MMLASPPKFLSSGPLASFTARRWLESSATSSVDETPDADVHHEPQCQKDKHCGRAAVTHKRQRNSGDRHETYHHSHIYQYVKTQYCRHAHGQKHPRAIVRALG